MGIHVYNTLTRKEEPLELISPGKVSIYVCGPTVYDDPHLGHARPAVVFDVITRYLKAQGHAVTYVRNLTDIDDKIIEKARQQNRDFKTLGGHYANRYHEAMRRLNVAAPDAEPKATDHILHMRDFISKLIQRDHAYQSRGNVYFAVESFKNYGRLSRRTVPSISSNFSVEQGKRHPADFALWKEAKPEEPSWASPWGSGRPGWHIECSAMSSRLLGENYDIHGGGADLVFPHHENEIAQSESLFGKTPANYWMHNGLVYIAGEKMSKSLGNALNLHGLLEIHRPEALRLFLLTKHYRHPMEVTHPALHEASARLSKLYRFLFRSAWSDAESGELGINRGALWTRFCNAMGKDFNFPMALSVLFEGIRQVNLVSGNSRDAVGADPACRAISLVSDIFFICRDVLGIAPEPSMDAWPYETETKLSDGKLQTATFRRAS
ncbi:MAG: cysteine--tRNA ligase [Deltaproteobacteria bacterium]|nr:cysteine--tRNA ligase [Deltaproteobacteria bacterium]